MAIFFGIVFIKCEIMKQRKRGSMTEAASQRYSGNPILWKVWMSPAFRKIASCRHETYLKIYFSMNIVKEFAINFRIVLKIFSAFWEQSLFRTSRMAVSFQEYKTLSVIILLLYMFRDSKLLKIYEKRNKT